MLEWLTELRKRFYVLDYWFVIQGYNYQTEEVHKARFCRKGHGDFIAYSGWPSQHFDVFSNPKALNFGYSFCGGFIM